MIDQLIQRAAEEATGLTFDELCAGLLIEPGDPKYPRSWPLTLPASVPLDRYEDVRPLAVALWLYSPQAAELDDHREAAARYVTEATKTLMIAEHRNRQARGGARTAADRKAKRERSAAAACELWHRLDYIAERRRAAAIAERLGLHPRTVRDYLRKTDRR